MKTKTMILRCALWLATGMMNVLPVAAQDSEQRIKELQEEMYKLFVTQEQEKFLNVTEQLKEECLRAGNEQLFYRAWGNQAIYEARHSHRNHATELAKEMKAYAKEHESHFGEYTALHVSGSVYSQMQNYDEAEANFLEAVEYLHQFFPKESAAADYLELITVCNKRKQYKQGKEYAKRVLNEPNLLPQHEIRALSMLCQYAGQADNREEFNEYYARWKEMQKVTPAGSLASSVEVDYLLLNGKYAEALELSKTLPVTVRAERQAKIYHIMGNDTKAYEYMRQFKSDIDSINEANNGSVMSDYIAQLHNERLENERLALEEEAHSLRVRYWVTLSAIIIALLGYIIWRRYKTIGKLREHNAQLDQARQAEHEARQEAEKALDVKREFLNNISHELRTPLNPITGFSDILATPGFELAPNERATMSQHIKDSSKVLTSIIDNMIELSFYESKSSLPRDDVFAPNVMCTHVVEDMRPLCNERTTIEFTTTLTNADTIKTDMQSLEKVFFHLVQNAIKYTESGTITLHAEEKGDNVEFSVTDTGIGIAPERQEHVFELFAHTGDNVKTTGMGLGICNAIVKLLGGEIHLDGSYTQGCRFVFTIPKE